MQLTQRIYEDYFKRSRIPEYKKILAAFREAGYKMVGILDFYNMQSHGGYSR